MNLNLRMLVTNSIFSSLGVRGLAIALKSLQIIILVRLYGSEVFGVYSVAVGVFGLTMVFAQLGLQHFVQREAAFRKHTSYTHLLRISWFLALPGLGAALIAQVIVLNFYTREVAVAFAVLVAAAPVYAIGWNQTFLLRGSGHVDLSLVLFEVINPIALVLTAIVLRGSALGLAFAFLSASVVTMVMTTIYANRLRAGETENIGSHGSIGRNVVEARSFYATSILQAIQSLADGLAVGYFLRPVDAALYAIITRMAGLVLIPIAILSMYMNNFVAGLREQPLAKIWRQMRTFTIASVSLSVGLSFVLMTLLPFIGMIFDTNFPPEAQLAYCVIVMTRALQGSIASVNSALFMSGREKYITRIHTVLLPLYLYVLMAFTPSHGLLGVSVSLFSYSLAAFFATILVLVSNIKYQSA